MNIIHAPQGSAEWLAVRAKHFTASEAPAMMGASKYQTRTELLRQKHTGIAAEVDENTQRLFDRGHAAEAAARPLVEDIIGDDLSPMTGALEVDGLPLLASFDGVTQGRDIVWESKLYNAGLAEQVSAGELDPHYYWQIEQQLLVSGAERAYFTTTDGTPENTVGMWYESVPERRAKLIAGWKQFAEDLANYQHVEATVAPVATPIEALPALLVQVEGRVLATNLDVFKARAQTFIDGIKTELVTDQDFADADKMVKFLKDGVEKLELAKQQALAQTASIDELFRTVDAIGAQMREKRLALERLVKAEKENRKAQIITEARQAIEDHIAKLNDRIGGRWMPPASAAPFAEAIKGLKTLDSMRDKVSTALSHAKIEANEIADTIQANRSAVPDEMLGLLFPDFASVCTKSRADFANLLAVRVAAHREAEEKRLEAERERIRQEEADKQRLRDAITANQTQFTAAALDQAATGTGVLTISSEGVEHVPVANFSEAINQAGSQNPTGDLHANAVSAASAVRSHPTDAAMITEFLALQACSPATKKEMRTTIEKWETYRVKAMAARGMAAAA